MSSHIMLFLSKHRLFLIAVGFIVSLSFVILSSNETYSAPSVDSNLVSQKREIRNKNQPNLSSFSLTKDVRKTVLENGLTIITKEVNTTPVVAVQIWYQVGSGNESAEARGIAHQLEHMMFKGTLKRPISFGQLFTALGSKFNASTSHDYTNYFHTAESKNLIPLLTLEADRLQNIQFDPEQFVREQGVVISELQGYENSPVYRLNNAVMKAAFPNSSYSSPISATKADVERLTLTQIRDFYRQYYTPDRATLVVVGNFDTEPTLVAIKELFGKIKNRASSNTAKNRTLLTEESTRIIEEPRKQKSPVELREPGNNLFLEMVYPLPAKKNADVPAINVLDAVLTSGRNSRLYQALVDSGFASVVTGSANNFKKGGWYTLMVTASQEQKPDKIANLVEETFTNLVQNGVSEAEVRRVKEKLLAYLVMRSRDISSQATLLGYSQTTAGDYRYPDRYLAAINRVTPEEVERVARQYFNPSHRTVGLFLPTKSVADSNTVAVDLTQTKHNFSLGSPTTSAEVEKYLPSVETKKIQPLVYSPKHFVLDNGLKILLLPDNNTPTITLSGYVRAGAEFDLPNLSGLAALTASNLMNGTQTKNALKISQDLEDCGANLSFTSNLEGVNFAGYSLAKDLPTLIATLSDVLQNAAFPTEQFELSLQQTKATLSQKLNNPSYLGQSILLNKIYPTDHPYHHFSTPESIEQITRRDIIRFYQTYYRPSATTIVVTGKFDPNLTYKLFSERLGSWESNRKPLNVRYPNVEYPTSKKQYVKPIAGIVGATTYMGQDAIDLQDPRYYTALVINQILGGNTLASRLGVKIREQMGISYGVFSFLFAGQHSGPLIIKMQTAPQDTQKAISSTIDILQQFKKNGATLDEVERAKGSLISTYTITSANPDIFASQILHNEIQGLEPEAIHNYIEQIEKIDLEKVNRVAKELLHPDKLVVVTVKPV